MGRMIEVNHRERMERNGCTWRRRFQRNWDTMFCLKILENKLYYQIGQWQSQFSELKLFTVMVFQGIEKGNILKGILSKNNDYSSSLGHGLKIVHSVFPSVSDYSSFTEKCWNVSFYILGKKKITSEFWSCHLSLEPASISLKLLHCVHLKVEK